MPRTIDVIRERNIDPGRYASPAVTPLPAEKRVRVNLVSSEWDTASAQTIRIGLERSFDDGATWQLWASIVTNPGRRDKNGAMPWISVPLYAGETYQARAFAEVEQRISLGATVETSDGTRIVLNPPQEPHSWADTGRKNETAGGGGNQVQIALNSTAAGSLIAVCGTYWSTSGANSISASDSVNGVYSEAFDSYYSDLGCGLDFHPNNAGGNLTVYVDTSGESNSFWAAVHEFSGGVTVNPLSGTPDTNTGSGVTLTAGPMTPADNDVLLLSAGVVDIQGTIAENAGSEGFTLSNELEGAWETSSFVFKIISGAPGTPSHSWTAGGSSTWTAGIAAFKPLGGGTYSPTKDAAYRVLTTQSPTKTAAYGILTTQSPTKTAAYEIQLWTCAQKTSNYPGSTASADKAFDFDVTVGNIVVIGWEGNAAKTVTVAQSEGTATIGDVVAGTQIGGYSATYSQMFWFPVTGTGSLTVRVSFTGATDMGWHQHEFHSVLPNPTITKETGEGIFVGDNATNKTTDTTSSVTTSVAGDLLVSLCGSENGTRNHTLPWGATNGTKESNHSSAQGYSLNAGEAGTPTATWSWDVDDKNTNGILWAFKAVASEGETLDQSAVRWRNDDGDEANATWAADENAQLTAESGAKRIRIQVNNTGDPATISPQFDWRRKPSGGSFGPWRKLESG